MAYRVIVDRHVAFLDDAPIPPILYMPLAARLSGPQKIDEIPSAFRRSAAERKLPVVARFLIYEAIFNMGMFEACRNFAPLFARSTLVLTTLPAARHHATARIEILIESCAPMSLALASLIDMRKVAWLSYEGFLPFHLHGYAFMSSLTNILTTWKRG